jgi:hypothetical protein
METFVPVFVLYPMIILIFARKYQWYDWREKLFAEVTRPEIKKED